MSMKRREFLAGALPLALALDGPSAMPSTSATPRVCLVAGSNGRPPDAAEIFEELGIGRMARAAHGTA